MILAGKEILMRILLPYDRISLEADLPDSRVAAVLRPRRPASECALSQEQLVQDALAHPIGSIPLHRLAESARRVLILSSDHTKPVPSRIIMPLLLSEIRKGNPNGISTHHLS